MAIFLYPLSGGSRGSSASAGCAVISVSIGMRPAKHAQRAEAELLASVRVKLARRKLTRAFQSFAGVVDSILWHREQEVLQEQRMKPYEAHCDAVSSALGRLEAECHELVGT